MIAWQLPSHMQQLMRVTVMLLPAALLLAASSTAHAIDQATTVLQRIDSQPLTEFPV
jgi:hypothetical protein